MTAELPLDFLTVYTPPGRPFFCVEPVSHATDAVNLSALAADVGMRSLEPGTTLRTAYMSGCRSSASRTSCSGAS